MHFLLVAHIFSVAKRIYNIVHSSIQKHKQNPEKKSSNLVTFSRLPNKYIISFIRQYRNTNKTQKKKIIKSGQIERRRKRERRLGSTTGEIARQRWRRDRRGASRDRRFAKAKVRSMLREGEIAIGTSRDRDQRGASQDRDRRGTSRDRDRCEGEIMIDSVIVLPLHVREIVLSLSRSPFARLWALFARLSSRNHLKWK